jgi:hypothetical protein
MAESLDITTYQKNYDHKQVLKPEDLVAGKVYDEFSVKSGHRKYICSFEIIEVNYPVIKRGIKTGTFRARRFIGSESGVEKKTREYEGTFSLADKGLTPYAGHGLWNANIFLVPREK